jgi:hypothetical protein
MIMYVPGSICADAQGGRRRTQPGGSAPPGGFFGVQAVSRGIITLSTVPKQLGPTQGTTTAIYANAVGEERKGKASPPACGDNRSPRDVAPSRPVEWRPTMTDDQPGPAAGPLPRREPSRLPGERLLRRRTSMSAAEATSVHPGGLRVRRGAFTAVVLRDNAPAGALWLDPDGGWRAAPGARAARAVSGNPDEEMLEALEERAPCFRRFAEAREWLLDALGGSDVPPPSPPDRTGPEGDRAARSGGRRGQVIQFASRRAVPRR